MTHLENNAHDRDIGAMWERRFCQIALANGRALTPMQLSAKAGAASWYRTERRAISRFLLPDVTVWTAPGEHHEVKHKDATRSGHYGLEAYRLDALVEFANETGQPVLYTIHDWRLAGATSCDAAMPNRLEDWLTVDIRWLLDQRPPARPMPTWLNGNKAEVPGYYWPNRLWLPLHRWWKWRDNLAAAS